MPPIIFLCRLPWNAGLPFRRVAMAVALWGTVWSPVPARAGETAAEPVNVLPRYHIEAGAARAWFGIRAIDLRSTRHTEGWLIASVQEGSPADRSGMAAGDIISQVDGHTLEGVTPAMLRVLFLDTIGSVKRLTLLKAASGRRQTLDLTPVYFTSDGSQYGEGSYAATRGSMDEVFVSGPAPEFPAPPIRLTGL